MIGGDFLDAILGSRVGVFFFFFYDVQYGVHTVPEPILFVGSP